MPGTSPDAHGGGGGVGGGSTPGSRYGIGAQRPLIKRIPIVRQISTGVLFGIAVSAFLHVVIAVLAAMAVLRGGGAGDSGRGEIELAIMTDAELTEFVRGELETNEPVSDEMLSEEVFETRDLTSSTSIEMLASLQVGEVGEIGLVGGASGDITGGGGVSGGAMGGGGAEFFGVEARGSRFAYVVDISGSMDDARMSALKREVIQSISGLLDHAKFTVVTYNSRAESLTSARWFVADERSKREVGSEVAGLTSSGGTEPSHAFAMVSRMRPKADAIYFMTDGKIAREEEGRLIRRINMMNRASGARTRVHCITFMNKDSERFMRRIARMTGGTYTHVSGGMP